MEITTVLVAVFKYIVINFDCRLSATVFLAGYQVAGSVGAILFSTVAGNFYDKVGPATTFKGLGLIAVIFMIFAAISLNSEKKSQVKIKTNDTFFS
ncbi:MFS transporter [Klebsiella pneumoniae]